MPKVLEKRVKAIKRSNPKMKKSSAWAIATDALQKEGKLKKGTRKKRYGGKVGLTKKKR